MTPGDMPSFDPYLIALLDGNMLTFAFLATFFGVLAKTAAKMSKRVNNGSILEWLAVIFGSIMSFRKDGGENGPKAR